jgi:cation/acetate symporter
MAGDYMSATATLLGLTALVFTNDYDGYLFGAFFVRGRHLLPDDWNMRNLKTSSPFAGHHASTWTRAGSVAMATIGSLTSGVLLPVDADGRCRPTDQLLFGLDYRRDRGGLPDGGVCDVRRHGPPTWVQIIKACLLLFGGTVIWCWRFSASASTPGREIHRNPG